MSASCISDLFVRAVQLVTATATVATTIIYLIGLFFPDVTLLQIRPGSQRFAKEESSGWLVRHFYRPTVEALNEQAVCTDSKTAKSCPT